MPALHHVQLAMPGGGEDAARAFFAGVLGWHEVAKPPVLAARGGCWFRSGGLEVHLGVEEGFRPARKAHPAICCEDLDTVLARLRTAGIEARPDRDLPGFRRVYVDDPFGNRLELVEPLSEERRAGAALAVVLDILERHGLAYQVGGGLAARAWGATRPLGDLDVWVNLREAGRALEELETVPEDRAGRPRWDAAAVVREIEGWSVRLLDAADRPRYTDADGSWHDLGVRLEAGLALPLLGRPAMVMPRAQLAEVKRRMDRDVDRLDLAALEGPPSSYVSRS